MKLTERISLDAFGNDADDDSEFASVSGDGRFVAFKSWATNLVPGDTNGEPDYFVRDRLLGTIERINVSSSGTQAATPPGFSYSTATAGISDDGRFIAFVSLASNLVPSDTNGVPDVFLRDRQLGTTERVNLDTLGNPLGPHLFPSVVLPQVSNDGRYVCFNSSAPDLVPGYPGVGIDLFVRDRKQGLTELVSVGSNAALGDDWSTLGGMTPDGRYIAFNSKATNFASGDMNFSYDVFVRDRMSGGPDVQLGNVVAGQVASLTITGATPGGLVFLGASLQGQGLLASAWGPLQLNGISAVLVYSMDGTGSASASVPLPSGLAGLPLWVHGIDLTMDYPTSVWGGVIQ